MNLHHLALNVIQDIVLLIQLNLIIVNYLHLIPQIKNIILKIMEFIIIHAQINIQIVKNVILKNVQNVNQIIIS